jgi:vacuolar-type H+-ATPase subunit I/STV1
MVDINKKISETLKKIEELRNRKKAGEDVKKELSKNLKNLKEFRKEKKKNL